MALEICGGLPKKVAPLVLKESRNWKEVVWVLLFAYVGVGARLLLTWAGRAATGVQSLQMLGLGYFLPNVVGSFAMGLIGDGSFRAGFCGSCTTFSTWQADVARRVVRGDVGDGVVNVVVGFAASFVAYRCGVHWAPARRLSCCPRWLGALALASITMAAWCLATLDDDDSGRRRHWAALCLGPLGAALRSRLSQLNSSSGFPLFTLLPNVAATAVDTIALVAATGTSSSSRSKTVWIDGGLVTGFSGSLSTVSTWIYELETLPLWPAYRYGLASIGLAQATSLLIMAIFLLSGGKARGNFKD